VRTFVATKNLGKLTEMRDIFAGSALELETYPQYGEVAEDADTYPDNARLKATTLRAQLIVAGVQGAVIADDSGLEAAALNGRPGVFSARYAGVDATWTVRRQELLDEIRATRSEDRNAKFVCAMVLLLPDGTEIDALGEIRGRIVEQIRGESGFGYDPLFVADGDTRTFAELSEQEKNATSHRGRAAAALLAALSDRRV
jgi:XTP/dITP diphosphohydrolase